MPRITSIDVTDVRFPTSLSMDGSDAMNKDGDYSATYVAIRTDADLAGFGFTFTIGRGNDVCTLAAQRRAEPLVGRDVDEVVGDLGATYRDLKSDSQMRWLGPDKGVEHLALAAVMNAVWDLAARAAGKPLWRLLVEMTPEELVDSADLTYLSDVLTREQAIAMLEEMRPTHEQRIAELEQTGYPCYTTSAGWLGYSDDKLADLARQAVADGFDMIKIKVGGSVADDVRRLRLAREVVGPDVRIAVDANQRWDVGTAVSWVRELAPFDPYWVEEPTSPDDVLAHRAIARAVRPVRVATGEHVPNRVVFKQLLQADAVDVVQIDACRVGGVNENVAILLLAAKFGVPVCPHAGGVGLCELVRHLAMFDFVAVSGTTEGRAVEWVDHLHEHFTDPAEVRGGRYRAPTEPGFSARVKERTLADFRYPDGPVWTNLEAR